MKNKIKITVTNVETGKVDMFECVTAVIGMVGADGIISAQGVGDKKALNVVAAFRAVEEKKKELVKSYPLFKKAVKFYCRKVKAVKVDD